MHFFFDAVEFSPDCPLGPMANMPICSALVQLHLTEFLI